MVFAFGKVKKKEVQQDTSKTSLNFLQEGNEEAKLEMEGKHPFEIQGLKDREKLNLMNFINCYKFLSPILEETASLEDQAEFTQQFILNSQFFALKVMEELKVPNTPNNTWIKNSLERIYSEVYVKNSLKNLSKNKKDVCIENIVLNEDDINDKIVKITEIVKDYTLNNYEKIPFIEFENKDLTIEMNLIKNINSILSLYLIFDFHKSQDDVLKSFTQFLQKKAEELFRERIDAKSLLATKEKTIYYLSLLNEIANVYSSIWKKKANEFSLDFSKKDEQEKQEWHIKNPNGYDLTIIEDEVSKVFAQLFNLTKTIIPHR